MRKTLIVLTLVVLTVLATAGNASAQRRGFGGGWGSVPYYYGGGGYYSPSYYYGDRGYSPYYQGANYGYAPSYYYTAPNYAINPTPYYNATPVVQTPIARPSQSFYSGPEGAQQSVVLTVVLPTADAQVWFGDTATTQQGTQRVFQSPALEPGKNFIYTLKARWMENGQAVERERKVTVQAGQRITVNFRDNSGEPAPAPDAIPRN
ncbi:hypothetical protein AYO44_15290 [Planctomycetaceae bacterium SCGC AG-212-F19]|nr:hypothetical protein AYO44_15290 [Planctomycetaceae bacterium SCGC AG-212-F19]